MPVKGYYDINNDTVTADEDKTVYSKQVTLTVLHSPADGDSNKGALFGKIRKIFSAFSQKVSTNNNEDNKKHKYGNQQII